MKVLHYGVKSISPGGSVKRREMHFADHAIGLHRECSFSLFFIELLRSDTRMLRTGPYALARLATAVLTKLYKYCTMQPMQPDSPLAETAESRLDRQAVQLETLLTNLVQAPEDNPFCELELSHRAVKVIFAVGDKGEITMTDLAAALRMPLSTLTRIVDRLKEKGLVERARSEKDRRAVVVRNSARGTLLYTNFHRHNIGIVRRMLAVLSFGEREILLELIAKLSRNFPDAQQAMRPTGVEE